MACSIAVCVKLRFSNTASTAESVTNVLTVSIITAGGSTIALAKGTTDNFLLSWFLLFYWSIHDLSTLDLRLQLILQWSTGILVLICCFIDRKQFSIDIATKLGSSFSLVPFVIVVALCTILAMVATLPIAQLLFFHVLLMKKGISTYDYIIALREQEQEQQGIGGHQSPQMSPASSLTGLSSASSFSTFHRGAWCTPPRLFLEDQFDVVPPDTGSVSSYGKKMIGEEPIKKKNPGAVKISPWTLARLNAEDVSKAAAEARKKSKILQPVVRRETSSRLEAESSFGSSGRQVFSRADSRRRASKRVSSSGAEESRRLTGLSSVNMAVPNGFPLSRSTSDGYEASGGEDSDRVPSRIIETSTNWSNVLFDSEQDDSIIKLKAPSSSSQVNIRML
ncbi:hypothetical protein V6Z11_A13G088200 [Gossypium hirsutum]